ncbi:MAG: type II toxin-antitoxin system RelB/DinJ family antitoxin [Clostridia bacterium]|nr:type II toxin-antitoxin system RelB/DinJ family antitoxin [Clostridia bacterium]MDE7328268.1 type II toxin-antitoxin system RelB/DinJ family antitoxin [Clostridia bacterium]
MKTNINIKVDTEIRDEAKELFGRMGLDMTTAVNMFLLAAIRERGIPFALTTIPKQPSDEEAISILASKLKRAEMQEKEGQMRNFDDFALELKQKYGQI